MPARATRSFLSRRAARVFQKNRHTDPGCGGIDTAKSKPNSHRLQAIEKIAAEAMVVLDIPGTLDLEAIERRLTVLDEKDEDDGDGRRERALMLRLRREAMGSW